VALAGLAGRCQIDGTLVHEGRVVLTGRTVDWSYLRMHEAFAITQRLAAVRQALAPRTSLTGLASARALDALLASDQGWSSQLAYTHVLSGPAPDPAGPPHGPPGSAPAPQLYSVDVTPARLDFGELAVSTGRTMTLRFVAPSEGNVSVTVLKPFQAPGRLTGRFFVGTMTSYTGEWAESHDGRRFPIQVKDQETQFTGSLDAHAGQEIRVQVSFQAEADDAGLPAFDSEILLQGSGWQAKLPMHANVTILGSDGFVMVNAHGDDVSTLQGHPVDLPVTLTNAGPARSVRLSPRELPEGFAFAPVTVALAAGETRDVSLHFDVAGDAPDVRGAPLVLDLVAGNLHHDVPLFASVYAPIKNFADSGDFQDVHYDMSVDVTADGGWTWRAQLHDKGFWYGDDYFIGFSFEAAASAGSEWGLHWERGSLGGEVAGGSQDHTILESGQSAWLRAHFFDIADSKMTTAILCNSSLFGDFVALLVGNPTSLLNDL
jgi:hypothetical protein